MSACLLSHLGICEQWSTKTAPKLRVMVTYRAFERLRRRKGHRGAGDLVLLCSRSDLADIQTTKKFRYVAQVVGKFCKLASFKFMGDFVPNLYKTPSDSFLFSGYFVPNLYKTASIKRCESRSSRVDQEVTTNTIAKEKVKLHPSAACPHGHPSEHSQM